MFGDRLVLPFFKQKKVEPVSALRFCQKPSELPYSELFEGRGLTLAVSRITRQHIHPADAFQRGASAYGLVHCESGLYDDGSEKPLLPFELSFEFDDPRQPIEHIGRGRCFLMDWGKSPYFTLSLHVSDPGGALWSALEKAIAHSVATQTNYFHLRCVRNEESLPLQTGQGFDYDALRARKKALDEGELELPRVVFDQVAFEDELVTKAPAWSWAWADRDMDRPAFHSAGAQKWRAIWAKYG